MQESKTHDDESSSRRGDATASDQSDGFLARNFLLIFGLLFFLIGLGALIGAVYDFKLEQRYAREGATAEGVVLTRSVHTTQHQGRRASTTHTYYDVTYRFQMPDGTTREGADSLSSDLAWGREIVKVDGIAIENADAAFSSDEIVDVLPG